MSRSERRRLCNASSSVVLFFVISVRPKAGIHTDSSIPPPTIRHRKSWRIYIGTGGRKIPCLFIRAISVVRFNPNLAAAPPGPPTRHPVVSNAFKIRMRSDSLKASRAAEPRCDAALLSRRGFGSTPSLASTNARSIRFCSSRMFPGHE